MGKIVVTGGCGYIGSHTAVDLIENGYDVISIDSNIRSKASILEGVKSITGKEVKNYQVDLTDYEATKAVFEAHPDIEGVIHFAALKSVGESVEKPLLYHRNNNESLVNILRCIRDYNVPNFIFSSSCTVYGNPEKLPVTEKTPMGTAESAYGRTKQIAEFIIQDFARANTANNSVILRYFNPAGAHPTALIGEAPLFRAVNLVPVITDTASGKRDKMMVFGDDYDTRDGSCLRDYIYIMDLANAHVKALQFLEKNNNETNCEVFNLGNGSGTTVLEAVYAFEKVTGIKLNYEIGPRRPGDVVKIYADNKKAVEKLDWQSKGTIEDIMKTAWDWEQNRKNYSYGE